MKTIQLKASEIEHVLNGFGGLFEVKMNIAGERIDIRQTRAGFADAKNDGFTHSCHIGCCSPSGCRDYTIIYGEEFLSAVQEKKVAQNAACAAWKKAQPQRTHSGPIQLWEPCEICGAEPSYDFGRHLCKRCAGRDHPRITGTELEHSVEPRQFIGSL